MDTNAISLLPETTTGSRNALVGTFKRANWVAGWSLLAPVLGMAASAALAWLGSLVAVAPAALYASLSLGLALIYLALIPVCEHGGRAALLLAIGQAALGMLCWQAPSMLHAGLALQTVVAAIWLLRDQSQGERAIAGLMLGLSTGAVVGLGLALAP